VEWYRFTHDIEVCAGGIGKKRHAARSAGAIGVTGGEDALPRENWYAEIAPPAALADSVLSLWEMRIPSIPGTSTVRILPNACVDIVLYASDPSHGEGAAAIVAPPHRSYVVGSTLRSFIVKSIGWRHVLGASLRPEGVQPLLGIPAGVIGESVAFLDDIIGPAAAQIEDRVLSGAPDGSLSRLAQCLQERRRAAPPPDETTHRAVELVQRSGGTARIDALLDELNVPARRLERNFLSNVGMSPKLFSRLVRFDRAVRDLGARGATPWSQFALAHGYADQAHFINEFREFAGVSPSEYEREIA
jgi:AraC-like DNA-binding protein